VARPRASDYDDKRRAILDRSAELFAAHGYDRASMSMIADACGVSKGLLYHYYRDKEALLFDMIRFHLEELLEAVEAANRPELRGEDRLRALAAALLEAYRDADAEHKVQINDLGLLSRERQDELKAMQRELVQLFADAICDVAPALKRRPELLKPVTMSLFGMLNWHYLWFKPDGPLSREDYAALAARLVADGTRGLAELGRAKPRRVALAGE
jgi:TetR/AcrR family transcriptional regulator